MERVPTAMGCITMEKVVVVAARVPKRVERVGGKVVRMATTMGVKVAMAVVVESRRHQPLNLR